MNSARCVSFRPFLRYGSLVLLALAGSLSAHAAGLTGDTVTCAGSGDGQFPLSCNAPQAVVGPGREFLFSGTVYPAGISENFAFDGVELTFNANALFAGTILYNSDLSSAFTGFLLGNVTGVTGFDPSDVSLTNGVLAINLRNTTEVAGATIDIGLTTRTVAATPEPASLTLLGTGMLAGLGLLRRKRN